MTEELFNRYTISQCTIDEKNIVEEWLEICSDEELAVLLKNRWDASYDEMPDLMSGELWYNVYQKITLNNVVTMNVQKRETGFFSKPWMAAASILFLLVSGYAVFMMNDKTVLRANQKANLLTPVDTSTWTTVKNDQKEHKIILLKDQSTIELFPFSTIRYARNFNQTERNLYLTGRAIFSVSKNKAKPFTVFSDEIATTAVGTRFQVNGDLSAGVVSVKLFEGIVKIQSTKRSIPGWENGKLLYPGEEVRFENGKATAKLNTNNIKQKVIPETVPVSKSIGDEIVFSNTPLSEVFETMEKLFGIKIIYDKKDVAGMLLTTTINRKDQPSSILNAIVQMNALNFQKNENEFVISSMKDNKQ